jgi:hypothetical protein
MPIVASEAVIEQESPTRTKILTWVVVVLVVGLVAAITVAIVNGSSVNGSDLTGEQRAEIKQAKSCDELGALHARYSPNADSDDAAAEATKLIEQREFAECKPAP